MANPESCYHEAGHIVATLYLQWPVTGSTVDPDKAKKKQAETAAKMFIGVEKFAGGAATLKIPIGIDERCFPFLFGIICFASRYSTEMLLKVPPSESYNTHFSGDENALISMTKKLTRRSLTLDDPIFQKAKEVSRKVIFRHEFVVKTIAAKLVAAGQIFPTEMYKIWDAPENSERENLGEMPKLEQDSIGESVDC